MIYLSNKPKMAYSRNLAVMDCHGWLSWMTFIDTFMDEFHRQLSWTPFMDDFHGWLSRTTFMDTLHGWLSWMTFMDDFHGWLSWTLSWTTFMDDFHGSWFKQFLHIVYWQTDWQTDGHWYLLSCYRNWKLLQKPVN